MIIDGQYYVQIAIGGQDFPATPSTIYDCYEINDTVGHIPTLQLDIRDSSGQLLNNYSIGDGVPIDVMTSIDQTKSPASTRYRMFGMPKARYIDNESVIHITGYLDAATYLRGMPTKPYVGNSSDAINQLASDAGLTAMTDGTNDMMTWRPFRKPFAAFAKSICDHGWVDDTSCMSLVVNRSKQLLYYDIAQRIKGQPQVTFTNVAAGQDIFAPEGVNSYQISAAPRVRDKSGPLNHWVGYGANTWQVDVNGNLQVYNPVQATMLSNNLEVSTQIQQDVDKLVRHMYYPWDLGNTFNKYIQAYHQNKRLRSLFATDVEILVDDDVNDFDIFDLATVDIIDPDSGNLSPAFSGIYICTAKTRAVFGSGFFTKCVLTTQGRNQQGLSQEA